MRTKTTAAGKTTFETGKDLVIPHMVSLPGAIKARRKPASPQPVVEGSDTIGLLFDSRTFNTGIPSECKPYL